MQCRSCGAQIADKAIVCYRCGASTTDPVRVPATLKRRRTPLFSFVLAALLLLLALYLGQASRTAADPDRWQTYAGLAAGAAVILVVVRVMRRR